MASTGILRPGQLRFVTRGQVLAWRTDPEHLDPAGATIRALASLYGYPCHANVVMHGPAKGVKRPKVDP